MFVDDDPISIPHRFTNNFDIEISGLFATTIAWGNRKSIICSLNRLLNAMNNRPYEFVANFKPSDSKYIDGFVHRTFNATDAIAFITSLQNIYLNCGGLENVFTQGFKTKGSLIGAIEYFRNTFVNGNFPKRSTKHVASTAKGSAAKRLNLYLRWMVRSAAEGVDFGIWKNIPTSELLIPLDVHTSRVSRKLGLLQRSQNDLKAVLELTGELKQFDANDPVKYDFALFGLGVTGQL